jgi:hypothetical protein
LFTYADLYISFFSPRKDWGKAFEEMHKNGDDRLLIDDVFDDETFEEAKFDEEE